MDNFILNHESCLTGDYQTTSVQMISSHVSNISTTTPTTAFSAAPSISPFGRSSVVGSDWINTENAFYGQIVCDLNSESEMIGVNNTHTRSLRMGWYSPSNAAYTAKQNITSSKTFHGDSFAGCYPPAADLYGEGGALYIAASGIKVNLTSCTFTDCHAPQGGVIRVRVDYTMTMNIDLCIFISCYATDQTGVYRSHNCGTDTITKCNFNNCSHQTCGTLFFIYASKVRVSGCSFMECTATTGSHSVVETFQTNYLKDLLFSNCSVIRCSTKSSAHMYFVANCQFQALVFHPCTTGSTDYGDVRGGTKHADLPSYSSNHMPHFNQETGELDQTINFPPWKVTTSGKNDAYCGFFGNKCQTVAYVLALCTAQNRARNAYAMQAITLLDTTHSIPAVPLADKAITIQGEKSGSAFNTKLIASTPTATFLSVTTGRLFVKDLHLVALSGGVFLEVAGTGQGKVTGCKMDTTMTGTMSTAFATCATGTLTIETSTFTGLTLSATALISATSGTLTITSSTASSINLAKNGLITTSGTSVTVTGSTFSSISNKNGDGGVLSVTLGSSNSLTVTTSSFKLNSATGRGGAVFVSTTSTQTQTESTAPFLTFGWGNEMCSADEGQNVFVSCSSISTELASRQWTTLKPALPERNLITAERETFKIVDGMSSEKLLYHWYPHTSGEVHLHSVGEDHTNCGVLELACVTMETAMTNMKTMKVVLIDSAFVRSTVFQSTAETWTLRQSSGCSLTLQDDGQIEIASGVNSALTLDTLTLNVGILTVGRSSSLFSVAAGTLTFSSCKLTIPSTIPATLIPITVTGGSLVITSGTVSLPPTLSSTFVKTSAGTTTISGVSFGNSALSESLISGTGTMSVKNCSFSTLTSKSTISLTVGASQTLSIGESGKTTTFRDCSSSTDGGAICCFVKETGKLVVVSTSFSDCSSSGNGGSIFLSLASTNNAQRTWDFDLSGTWFSTDSAANGAAIYVSGSYFETAITPSRFPSVSTSTPPPLFWGTDSNSSVSSSLLVYLIPISNIVSVGGTGAIDIDDCGHFGVPCLTIGKGLERAIPSSDTIQIKVHANSALKSSYSVVSSLSVWIVGDVQASNGYLTVTTVASDTLLASSGSLSISQLAFTGTSGRDNPFFQLSSGASLALTSCSFTGFSSFHTGSIVFGRSSVSNGLKLTNVAFSSCSATAGGGVIDVTLSSSASLALSGSVSFTDCSSGSSHGHKIRLHSSDLITLLSDSGSGGILDSILPSIGSTGIFTSAEKEDFWGFETQTGGSSGSLLFFRHPHTTGAVHLHENGEDHLHCGETTLPCLSLAHSLMSMKSEKEVRLDSSLTLTAALMSSHAVWTLSASSTDSLSLTQNAQISLKASPSSTVTFSSLPMTISNLTSGRTTPMFSVESGSLTLSNCKITVPSAIPATLIPMTITGGSLVITSGTITLPSALSKSFLSSTAGTTTISGVSFGNSALSEPLIYGTGTMSVKNCSFSTLTSKSTISLTVGASQTLSIGESGKTTTFRDCSSSTDGGAICCFVKETGKLVVVSTSFSDCSSSGNGGSIFLSLTSTNNAQRTWDFDLSGASFSTDSAAEGAAVFVSGSFFETAIATSRFPTVSSSTEPTLFWGTDSKTTVSSSLLVYLVTIGNVVSVGGSNSHDIDDCGHFGVPCLTIGKGLERAIPSSNTIQITVHTNSPLKSSYSVASSLSVWIVGDVQASNGYLTVTTVASDTLIASSGSLSISQLAFTGTSDRSVSFFQLSSGGSLALTLCEFSGFSSSVGGSIVSGTSSVSNGLKLTNVAFSSCSSSLDGGVIAVTLSSSASLALSGSVSFTDCSSGTSNGHKMHLTSSDLITLLSDSGSGGILDSILPSIGSTGIFTSAEKEEFWGYETKTAGSSGSLLFFRHPHTTGAVHLHVNGEDHLHCGETPLPCQSLAHSLASMKSEKEVRLDSSLTLSTVFESLQPLWTLSASSGNSLALTQNAQLCLTSSSSSTVTLFALPITIGTLTTGRTTSLFSIAAGSLTLSNCHLTIPSSIPSTINPITITGGSLVITSGTITLPSALSKSFLSSTAGTTTISAVSFANSALSEPLIYGTGTMSVKNCSFSTLTSKSTISLTVGASQTLSIGESGKTTTFRDCSSSTDGGAICCFVKETGKLVVVSTSFSDCSSSGNGGSIFLSLASTNNAQRTWDFDLSGVSSTSGIAALGSSIFVSGSYFESSITPSRFPSVSSSTEPTLFWGTDTHSLISSTLLVYLVPLSNVVLVGGPSSMDFVSCGLIWVPCSTLDFGQSRLAASGEPKNVISVVSNLDFSTTVTHSSSNELSIEGDTLHTLFLSSSARFVISFGSVSFSNLTFRLPSSLSTSPLFELTTATLSFTSTVSFSTSHFLTPFTSPVFLLHSGTLSTAGTQFDFSTQLTLTAASLMIVETASVQLTDSLFSNIKSTSDGAALHATITTNTLTIDHSSFKKCLSSERGGGILLDVAGMGGSGDYRLLGVEFGRVEEKNKADAAGHDVFVVGRVLSEVVTFNRWTGSLSGSSFDDLMGMDDSSPNFVSLLPLLIGNVFFVGPDGSDLGSGTESSPFLTLSKVLKEALMVENERMGVVMKGDAAIGGVVESGGEHEQTKTVTIEGSREGCRILCSVKDEEEGRKMKKREAMIVIRRHSFEISHLVLSSFSPSSDVNAVFSISETGKLKLEGCSIRSESELSLSLISVKSLGELELISFRTENVEFVGKGGVVGCGGESVVKMDGCEFSSTSFEDGAVVWGRTTRGLSILSSQFISCVGKSFGSLIRVSVVGCVGEIKRCSFLNCRTEVRMDERAGVGGGCVVMEMDTRTTKTRHLPRSCVDLSESVFDSCELLVIHGTEQRRCVGGSGFLVVGKERSDWVSLRDVIVSDCVCSEVRKGRALREEWLDGQKRLCSPTDEE